MLINQNSYFLYVVIIFSCFTHSAYSSDCRQVFNGHSNSPSEEERTQPSARTAVIPAEILNQMIFDYLDFSFLSGNALGRLRNNLFNLNIITIRDLIQKSREYLLRQRDVREKQTNALEYALGKEDLSLGMKLSDEERIQPVKVIPEEILDQDIFDYLDFSFLSDNALTRLKHNLQLLEINKIRQAIRHSRRYYVRKRGMGEAQTNALEYALEKRDLYLPF
ncbi:MAG: hypothetical protein OXK80_00415 [Bdellovibrionales bacterium]|nr:hypothetical protein [Bdellovibrionales bacterium]